MKTLKKKNPSEMKYKRLFSPIHLLETCAVTFIQYPIFPSCTNSCGWRTLVCLSLQEDIFSQTFFLNKSVRYYVFFFFTYMASRCAMGITSMTFKLEDSVLLAPLIFPLLLCAVLDHAGNYAFSILCGP